MPSSSVRRQPPAAAAALLLAWIALLVATATTRAVARAPASPHRGVPAAAAAANVGRPVPVTRVPASGNGTGGGAASDDDPFRYRLAWKCAAGSSDAHTGAVNDCRYSPDGQHVASAGGDGLLKLWNAESGALVAESRPILYDMTDAMMETAYDAPELEGRRTSELTSLAWSSDGSAVLVALGPEGALATFDVEAMLRDGRHKRHGWSWRVNRGLNPHASAMKSVSWSTGGIFWACGDRDGDISIWDAESRGLVRHLPGSGGGARVLSTATTTLAWHPLAGDRFVSGSAQGYVAKWSAPEGTISWRASGGDAAGTGNPGALGPVRSCAWHPSGRSTACGDDNGRIWMLENSTGAFLDALPVRTDGYPATCVRWRRGRDSERMIALDDGGVLSMWSLPGGAAPPPSASSGPHAPTRDVAWRALFDDGDAPLCADWHPPARNSFVVGSLQSGVYAYEEYAG